MVDCRGAGYNSVDRGGMYSKKERKIKRFCIFDKYNVSLLP
jgi:hypothetical protein